MMTSQVSIGKPPESKGGQPAEFAMEERIYFAALALQNVQELNARADSKAYLVLTANGFLIAFIGVAAPSMRRAWEQGLSPAGILLAGATAALILSVAVSLMHAFRIISPRLKRRGDKDTHTDHGKQVDRSHLIFFLDIISAFNTDREYANALLTATPEELLTNLSSSIFGASISAHEKYDEARKSIRALGAVLAAWVVFVLLTFAMS